MSHFQVKLRWMIATLVLVSAISGCNRNGKEQNPSGTLEATEVTLNPAISGKVIAVLHDEGETVLKGDTLAVLDTEMASLQRDQAIAQLEELSAMSKSLQSQKEQLQRQFANSGSKLQRQEAMLKAGSSTQQTVDDATTAKDVLELQLRGIDAQLAANRAQQTRVDATRKISEKQIRDGVITAPLAGSVIVNNLSAGEMVTPQTVAFTLADWSKLYAKIYLAETELASVTLGKSVSVIPDASDGKGVAGTISFISAVAEFTPKNIQTKKSRSELVFAVKVMIQNPDRKFHPGMPVEVTW